MESVYSVIVERPRAVLAALSLVTAFFGLHASRIAFDGSVEAILPANDPHKAYADEVRRVFGSDEIGVVGLFADDVYAPATLAKLRRLTGAIEATPGVEAAFSLSTAVDPIADVLDPPLLMPEAPKSRDEAEAIRQKVAELPIYLDNLVSADGRAAAINVVFEKMSDDDFLRRGIDERIEAALAAESGPETLHYTGLPHFKVYSVTAMRNDLVRFVPLTLLTILAVLFFSFRSFRGMWLPALAVVVGLVWTLGLMVLFGARLTVGSFPLPPLLLVIGTAYSLHVIAEYYDLVAKGGTPSGVVRETLRQVGAPVAITAATTVIGFLSLVTNSIPAIRQMGLFASIGIAIAFGLSLVLVPAILVLLPLPAGKASLRSAERLGGALREIGRFDIRHRRTLIGAGALACVVAAAFLFSIRADSNYGSFFPPSDPIRQATDAINEKLVGAMAFTVMVDGEGREAVKPLEHLARIRDLQRFIDALPGVDKTVSLIDYLELLDRGSQHAGGDVLISPEGEILEPPAPGELTTMWDNLAQYAAVMQLLTSSPRTFSAVVNADFSRTAILVRTNLMSSAEITSVTDAIENYARDRFPPELAVRPTGSLILLTRTTDDIITGQVESLAFAAAIMFAIMSVMFLSTRVGLIAMLPNLFPILIFFGLLGASGAPLNLATSIIASIALGLAIDNTIHIMTRLSLEVRATGNQEEALLNALASVGKPALYASLLCLLGFLVLGFSRFLPIREFGLLSAATVTVGLAGDLVLLPALIATTRIITIWDLLYLKLGPAPHRTIPLFETLRPAQAKIVALMGELKRFARGEPVIRQGERGCEMYVLIDGRAEVRIAADGGSRFVRELRRGDVFGEMGLLRQHERTADVIAVDDLEVLAMNERFLERVQRRYPRIASKIFFNISKILSDRLEKETERVQR